MRITASIHTRRPRPRPARAVRRQRGVAAILAMTFLVIFSSLAASMAIIAHGNLTTADAHLRINRSLAAAETGMQFVTYRLGRVSHEVTTRIGDIDDETARALWEESDTGIRDRLIDKFLDDDHLLGDVWMDGNTLAIGPIAVGPNAPQFTARLTPHPLEGENYDGDYYNRPPYWDMDPPVSNQHPLDHRFIRVEVTATDGSASSPIERTIQMDFRIVKQVRFAVLSQSRVMIGQNVQVEGPVGSRFTDTHLEHGHPIHMMSDFWGLHPDLDETLSWYYDLVADYDVDFSNRLNLKRDIRPLDDEELMEQLEKLDVTGDGYVDDYDLFLHWMGVEPGDSDWEITAEQLASAMNLDDELAEQVRASELVDVLTDGGDAVLPGNIYHKLSGQVYLESDLSSWADGAAESGVQHFFQGSIDPDHRESPTTFGADEQLDLTYEPDDFDVATFRAMTSENAFYAEAGAEPDYYIWEQVPFGAAYPYEYYRRPVYENRTFENARIPMGTNALFIDCTFRGVTFVDTTRENADPMFNYAGMLDKKDDDYVEKYPGLTAEVYDPAAGGFIDVDDTRHFANNLRFHNATIEGILVGQTPKEFTHVRNKVQFTGRTKFEPEAEHLTAQEAALFRRSNILMPHWSVELGTFVSPYDSGEQVDMTGSIVAGIIDMRGNINLEGSLITTFQPVEDEGPVIGETSPNFNVTLGYFAREQGDMEAELPTKGLGAIRIRYNPEIPLPDGIKGPVQVMPLMQSYSERNRY